MEKKVTSNQYTKYEKLKYYEAMLEKACQGLNRQGVDPRDMIAAWLGDRVANDVMAKTFEAAFARDHYINVFDEIKKKRGA